MRIATLSVAIALFACEKSGDEATPTASAAPAPSAEVAPAPSAEPEPAASASAGEPEEDVPEPVADKTAATPDAGAPVKRTDTSASYKSVMACCNALSSAAKKDPRTQNKYTAAAAVCSGIAQQVKKGGANPSSARTLIRAQLHGVAVPGGC